MALPAPVSAPLQPLLFTPILKPKVWGGRRFEALGKPLPPREAIGESWEMADLDQTSASGAGGAAEHSVVASGPFAGRTIRDLVRTYGSDFLGHAHPSDWGGFPLLIKFLDAREHLSVQVHPSPAYIKAHAPKPDDTSGDKPAVFLKTESWYIIAAESTTIGGMPQLPVVYKGLKPGVTRAQLEDAIKNGHVPEVMRSFPAVPGELHHLPSGTVHALGAGVLIAEVQTPSDTTFRVYDWEREYNRTGRALHVRESLECIDFGEPLPAVRVPAGEVRGRLASTEFYTIDEVRIGPGASVPLPDPLTPACAIVMVLSGSMTIEWRGGATLLPLGATAVIPAPLVESARLVGVSTPGRGGELAGKALVAFPR